MIRHSIQPDQAAKTKRHHAIFLIAGSIVLGLSVGIALWPSLAFAQADDILDQSVNSLNAQTGGMDSGGDAEEVNAEELAMPDLADETDPIEQQDENTAVEGASAPNATVLVSLAAGALVVVMIVLRVRRRNP